MKLLLRKGPIVSRNDINEENFVDNVELVASMTTSAKGRTAMEDLGTEMAYLCFINDMNFKRFGERHKLGM